MDYKFPLANKLVGLSEKGFVIDNGGPTNHGITIPFLQDYWRKVGISGYPTEETMRTLPKAVADKAYEVMLWMPLRCEDMPAGVGYTFFDAAVNSGAPQATKWLQRIVGTKDDGLMGPLTIAAVQRTDPIHIIKELCVARSRLMLGMNNATEELYERGWHARLIEVVANAVLMNVGVLK